MKEHLALFPALVAFVVFGNAASRSLQMQAQEPQSMFGGQGIVRNNQGALGRGFGAGPDVGASGLFGGSHDGRPNAGLGLGPRETLGRGGGGAGPGGFGSLDSVSNGGPGTSGFGADRGFGAGPGSGAPGGFSGGLSSPAGVGEGPGFGAGSPVANRGAGVEGPRRGSGIGGFRSTGGTGPGSFSGGPLSGTRGTTGLQGLEGDFLSPPAAGPAGGLLGSSPGFSGQPGSTPGGAGPFGGGRGTGGLEGVGRLPGLGGVSGPSSGRDSVIGSGLSTLGGPAGAPLGSGTSIPGQRGTITGPAGLPSPSGIPGTFPGQAAGTGIGPGTFGPGGTGTLGGSGPGGSFSGSGVPSDSGSGGFSGTGSLSGTGGSSASGAAGLTPNGPQSAGPSPNCRIPSRSGISPSRTGGKLKKLSDAEKAAIGLGLTGGIFALAGISAAIANAVQVANKNRQGKPGQGRGGPSPGLSTPTGVSGGGRQRRSVRESKVSAEILDAIPMDFERLY